MKSSKLTETLSKKKKKQKKNTDCNSMAPTKDNGVQASNNERTNITLLHSRLFRHMRLWQTYVQYEQNNNKNTQ